MTEVWIAAEVTTRGAWFGALEGMRFSYRALDSNSSWRIIDRVGGREFVALEGDSSLLLLDGVEVASGVIPQPFGLLMGLAHAAVGVQEVVPGSLLREDAGDGLKAVSYRSGTGTVRRLVNHFGFVVSGRLQLPGDDVQEFQLIGMTSSKEPVTWEATAAADWLMGSGTP